MDFLTPPRAFTSNEVEERINELVAEFVDATGTDPAAVMSVDDWNHGLPVDEAEELAALIEFRDEADCVSDWNYGAEFIRDNAFETYAMGQVWGMHGLENLPEWIRVDWPATAENLQAYYTDYELLGETYWVRG